LILKNLQKINRWKPKRKQLTQKKIRKMQELLVQIKHTMSIVNLSKEKKHNQGRAITKCSKKWESITMTAKIKPVVNLKPTIKKRTKRRKKKTISQVQEPRIHSARARNRQMTKVQTRERKMTKRTTNF